MSTDPTLAEQPDDRLDEAEQTLLDALRPDHEFDGSDLEQLCASRPELARELRSVYARFTAVRGALRIELPSSVVQPSAPDALIAGRFRPLGMIGRGGMSIVLAAWDQSMRRKVALKCVRAPAEHALRSNSHLERRRARLIHESQVLAQLDHPGIVPVYDVVRDEQGEPYVAMLRVRGVDLREIYQRCWNGDGEWSLARVVGVLQRAFEAVAYAHRKGVLHRDLKPANVMIGSFGEGYVMDWGLARTRASAPRSEREVVTRATSDRAPPAPNDGSASLSMVVTDRDDSDSQSALYTQEGDVIGTPSYMSPEQAAGKLDAVDARSDVYSAGAMLYELLARRAPYVRPGESRSSAEIVAELLRTPPEPLGVLAREAPIELIAIADRAMARDKERRYAGMRELADDLRAFLEGRVVRAHRTGAWIEARKWIGRHKAVVGVLSTLLVTLLSAGIVLAYLYRQSEQRRERLQTAQLDSQRRINALRGFGAAGTPATSFFDDFTGEHLHRRWVAKDRPDLVLLRDGELVLRSEGDAQSDTSVELDSHVSMIRGDFDLRVRFRLDGFEWSAVPRSGRVACLFVYDLASGHYVAGVQREVENEPQPHLPWQQSYRAYDESTANHMLPEHALPIDDRSGTLRVTRESGECAVWVARGGWHKLFSAPAGNEPVGVRLMARTWYSPEPFDFVIESVELTTRPDAEQSVLASLDDAFESNQLDPRYALHSSAGIAAQVGGRLCLETFEGVAGGVVLGLDQTRWCLRGDFELEVDYELASFLAPAGPGVSRVRVDAQGGHAPMGSISFDASPEGRIVRGFYHREERRRPLERERGRLRIERTGTDLRLGIEGPSGWDWLVERPHVSAGLDFGFALIVDSPAESAGVVASFDNLRVSSVSRR